MRLVVLTAFSLILVLPSCSADPRPAPPPNIILITLDTTRVDRLGCYGHSEPTSPNLDALAQQSMVYTRAVSTSSWTLPAHASLFTGKVTSGHGAQYDPEGPLKLTDGITGPEAWNSYRARGIAEDETTLAMLLRDHGYATGAVVAGPWMKRAFGLAEGFEHYDDAEIGSLNGRSASQVTTAALAWIDGVRLGGKPFFLFVNYYDPHAPYAPPPEFASRFLTSPVPADRTPTLEETNALYDAEIAYMDQQLGMLLERLRQWSAWENTWIIVTADHGELLGEHGLFGHGRYLFQPEIHVPFIVKHPGPAPASADRVGRSDLRIQHTDLLPWICAHLEIPVPQGVQGGAPPRLDHPVIAETYPLPFASPHGSWQALFEDDWKLLWNGNEQHALFDLSDDPAETHNLIDDEIDRARSMAVHLLQYLESIPEPGAAPAAEIDPETQEALESLGYTN